MRGHWDVLNCLNCSDTFDSRPDATQHHSSGGGVQSVLPKLFHCRVESVYDEGRRLTIRFRITWQIDIGLRVRPFELKGSILIGSIDFPVLPDFSALLSVLFGLIEVFVRLI